MYGNRKAGHIFNMTEANKVYWKNDHNFMFSGEETTKSLMGHTQKKDT